ncbi:DMT family transporter [Kaistella polysaccharea]|uniref:DMT family transporter n=1 Tax=Kaistella polysaccharea TaxID=2878534 RepID=UPI001CF40CDB|nr:SMR family transporter [Kaistella polysaccharea]
MNWIILIIGGLFETGFALCLGKAQETTGKESYFWWAGFAISLFLSMFLLYKAISVGAQPIPIGTAYAVWTGIGAVGAVVTGILIFNEFATFWRMFFAFTLIASVIGLKAVSN